MMNYEKQFKTRLIIKILKKISNVNILRKYHYFIFIKNENAILCFFVLLLILLFNQNSGI